MLPPAIPLSIRFYPLSYLATRNINTTSTWPARARRRVDFPDPSLPHRRMLVPLVTWEALSKLRQIFWLGFDFANSGLFTPFCFCEFECHMTNISVTFLYYTSSLLCTSTTKQRESPHLAKFHHWARTKLPFSTRGPYVMSSHVKKINPTCVKWISFEKDLVGNIQSSDFGFWFLSYSFQYVKLHLLPKHICGLPCTCWCSML